MRLRARPTREGSSLIEILAVAAVIALLLAMGFVLYGSMRAGARVSLAESRLNQVSVGLELYFRKFHSYPPQGSDLAEELAEFVGDPTVFENPLREEERPGQDITAHYRRPDIEEIDEPGNYVTALPADDGTTVVVLETGNRIERRDDLSFDPAAPPGDLLAQLDPGEEPSEEDGDAEDGFDVQEDGEAVTKLCSDVAIKAIGSQFGYADGTLVPIAAEADMGDGWFDLYSGQPIHGGETFERASVAAGTVVTLKGEIIGAYERWLYSYYGYPLSYTSTDGSGQVLVYERGDEPPAFQPGFPCQASAGDLVASYVDPQTGVVTIAENEALYLWDFNPLQANYGIDYQDLIVLATAVAAEVECDGETEAGQPPADPAGVAVNGTINLNPRNNSDFEFSLTTPGGVFTRDTLHNSNGAFTYEGSATEIRVCPKGNGNQNGLTVDGAGYSVRNGTVYTIKSTDMTVRVYHDSPSGNGNAMGKWWIEISATDATITP